ncbi:MAG TPA: GntR family transcriptional regulator [Chloroflexi bacterium]|nr:GntR family transcriptional regulator [Chloroflexota bacterium]
MEIQVDHESGVPIYAQIIEQIKHLVATGRVKPGDQLPTIRQLAVDLRVNPNTVVHAYRELDSQGVISTQQGRGTFIAARPDEGRLAEMRKERLRAIIDNALLEALSLGYEAGEIREALEKQLEEWEGYSGQNW